MGVELKNLDQDLWFTMSSLPLISLHPSILQCKYPAPKYELVSIQTVEKEVGICRLKRELSYLRLVLLYSIQFKSFQLCYILLSLSNHLRQIIKIKLSYTILLFLSYKKKTSGVFVRGADKWRGLFFRKLLIFFFHLKYGKYVILPSYSKP